MLFDKLPLLLVSPSSLLFSYIGIMTAVVIYSVVVIAVVVLTVITIQNIMNMIIHAQSDVNNNTVITLSSF